MARIQPPPDTSAALLRVEAASALLARGLLGLAPLDESAESACIWLDQAVDLLENAA